MHDFQTMNLVDRALQPSKGKGKLDGYPVGKVTTASLNAAVNLANPASYAKPGAAPNGADYVQLQAGRHGAHPARTSSRSPSTVPRRWRRSR